jgi:hypothetical protein
MLTMGVYFGKDGEEGLRTIEEYMVATDTIVREAAGDRLDYRKRRDDLQRLHGQKGATVDAARHSFRAYMESIEKLAATRRGQLKLYSEITYPLQRILANKIQTHDYNSFDPMALYGLTPEEDRKMWEDARKRAESRARSDSARRDSARADSARKKSRIK